MDAFPASARDVLEPLVPKLEPHADSLIVYGSLARGAYRAGVSNINLLVLLQRATLEILRTIGPTLRAAYREAKVETILLETGEVADLADAFPIKFLDIQRNGIVLFGTNPFTGLDVEKKDLRVRIEQELRNHLLRLRRRYSDFFSAPDQLLPILIRSVASLRVELSTVIEVARGEAPGGSWEELFEAARPLKIDRAACERLASFHDNPDALLTDDTASMLFETLDWAIRVVEDQKENN